MWENTIWNETEDVVDVGYEVEKITAVAGVRGAEAEDEALALLYYRKSMKGLSKLDLQKALGKLIIKRKNMNNIFNSRSTALAAYWLKIWTWARPRP